VPLLTMLPTVKMSLAAAGAGAIPAASAIIELVAKRRRSQAPCRKVLSNIRAPAPARIRSSPHTGYAKKLCRH
jgi:hypothetical protein